MKRMLSALSLAFTTSLSFCLVQTAWAQRNGPKTYATHQGGLLLPTGCPLGAGDQYQDVSPELGRIVTVGEKTWVDFNPVALSRRAADICHAQISGQGLCQNACGQLWVRDLIGTRNKIDDPAEFAKCIQKCPGVPTFSRPKGAVENETVIAK